MSETNKIMIHLRTLFFRLRGILGKPRAEQELDLELQAHLDLLTQENILKGMRSEEARYAARREFGGVEQTKGAYREQRGLPILETLLQDVCYGLRMLASFSSSRRWGFTPRWHIPSASAATRSAFAWPLVRNTATSAVSSSPKAYLSRFSA